MFEMILEFAQINFRNTLELIIWVFFRIMQKLSKTVSEDFIEY